MDGDVLLLTAEDASPTFLVGIAGCASTGKMTLANTLAEIFAPFVDERPGAESAASPGRVTVIHQDDYSIAKEQCPRASFRPRLPLDEKVVAGDVQGDGEVTTADADCLEAVDWVRLTSDVEEFLNGGRKNMRPTECQRLRNRLEDKSRAAEPFKLQRDAIKAYATVQMQKNAEGGFKGKYFKGANGTDKIVTGNSADLGVKSSPILGCRLGILEGSLLFADDTGRQPLESRDGEESRSDAGRSELSMLPELDESDGREDVLYQDVIPTRGQPRGTKHDLSGHCRKSLWRRSLQRIKSPLQLLKDPSQGQWHPGEHTQGDRDGSGNGDRSILSEAERWSLRELLQRAQRSILFASDSNQRQPGPSGSDESIDGMVSSEQSTITPESAGPSQPIELESEEEDEEDTSSTEQSAEPVPGGRVQPSSVRARRITCDKSTCLSCKGKGVEGRSEPSPCRALIALDDPFRLGNGGVPGYQDGESEGGGEDVRDGNQPPEYEGDGPSRFNREHLFLRGGGLGDDEQAAKSSSGSPDQSSTLREELLRRMDVRLFLVARKDTAVVRRFCRDVYVDEPQGQRQRGQMWRARGYFEDVVWHNHGRYHGHLGLHGLRGADLHDEVKRSSSHMQCLITDEIEVEAVVTWAVEAILKRMVELEETYRMGRWDNE
ncbi:hypothetical protein VP1G_02218 [Cytospora mali]|uniref:Uncharacterized protein n=1 Tax=Cytospora mali TaxID=578113 RepID=A0A194UTH7_CYTMA|nr:hypothetical protein VP1G_02218 [Valsa mali var. pyri (nom. inval.)]